MDSPQSRASLRVIKPSPKLNPRLQPKIKSAKAEKNNYSNFAAARCLLSHSFYWACPCRTWPLASRSLPAPGRMIAGPWPSALTWALLRSSLPVLVAPAEKRAAVVRYAAPAIVTTSAISAAMNGFAFAAMQTTGDQADAGQHRRRVDDRMDFAVAAAFREPDCLKFGPPFRRWHSDGL
jgi:hypothetical protein